MSCHLTQGRRSIRLGSDGDISVCYKSCYPERVISGRQLRVVARHQDTVCSAAVKLRSSRNTVETPRRAGGSYSSCEVHVPAHVQEQTISLAPSKLRPRWRCYFHFCRRGSAQRLAELSPSGCMHAARCRLFSEKLNVAAYARGLVSISQDTKNCTSQRHSAAAASGECHLQLLLTADWTPDHVRLRGRLRRSRDDSAVLGTCPTVAS